MAGELVAVLGAAMAVPGIVGLAYGETRAGTAFLLTGAAATTVGAVGAWRLPRGAISWRAALLLCTSGWVLYSLIGAIPLSIAAPCTYLDAAFEASSGFTTTGLTVLGHLEPLPRCVLLWRAMAQWMGGLGILSFFLLVSFPGGEAYRLLLMEGTKALVERPVPGVRGTLIAVWQVYGGLTAACIVCLWAAGMSGFSALAHGLTTVSTGGFSIYDANLGHYGATGHPRAPAIELTAIVFMLAGGLNFLSYHLLLRGRPRQCAFGFEARTYWTLLGLVTALVVLEAVLREGQSGLQTFRTGFFTSASLLSSAGFTLQPLYQWTTRPASLQALMVLMLIGGCVGSTAGGLKILRVVVLWRFTWHQVRRSTYPSRYCMPFAIGGRPVPPDEVGRMVMLTFCWIALIVAGSVVTALLGRLTVLESLSVSLSAVSNSGPCLIGPERLAGFGAALKVFYVALMIAGRLEVLPVLTLFTRRAWSD